MTHKLSADQRLCYDSGQFAWKGAKGHAHFSDLGPEASVRAPRQFDVMSRRTGLVIRFFHDDEAYLAHEGWDGEQRRYASACGLFQIDLLND
jgi:hypothetical protein